MPRNISDGCDPGGVAPAAQAPQRPWLCRRPSWNLSWRRNSPTGLDRAAMIHESISSPGGQRGVCSVEASIDPTGPRRPSSRTPTGLETTQSWNARRVAQSLNLSLIEDYYQRWLNDPGSVDGSWRNFFEGYELGRDPRASAGAASTLTRHAGRRRSRA